MRKAWVVGWLCFFVVCTAVAQSADRHAPANTAAEQRQKRSSENDGMVESACRYAHTIAERQLSSTDRVEVLLRLANAAGKKHPEKAKQWAVEALRLADEMGSAERRTQYETEAISALAAVDSEEALTLLPGLDVPASSNDDDARTEAAKTVFSKFINQHPGDWEKLSVAAQRMGDTGHYPFGAVQTVVSRIGKKNPEAAATLMLQAIHYYNLNAHSPVANNQMATLLVEDARFVPGSTLKATVETMLSNLRNSASPENLSAGTPRNPSEDASLVDLNRATLAILLPLLSSVDPEMERKLRQEIPSQDPMLDAVASLESAPTIVGPATVSSAESLSMILLGVGTQSPAITFNSVERSDGGDTVAMVRPPSQDDVSRLLEDSDAALEKAQDPEQRLEILTERALSLVAGKRRTELSNALVDALAVGEKLFRKSVDENPQASWNSRPGARELSTLVEAAAKTAPQVVLESLRNVHDSVLQAQLYVSFVEGLQSDQDFPSVFVVSLGT